LPCPPAARFICRAKENRARHRAQCRDIGRK
jgi:hypothetical protein